MKYNQLLFTFFFFLFSPCLWAQKGLNKKVIEEGLTDEQKREVDGFYHQGLLEDTKKGLCSEGDSKDLERACEGRNPEFTYDVVDTLIPYVSKAYGVLLSTTGKKSYPIKGSTETVSDVCRYIPAGTEVVAKGLQTVQDAKAMGELQTLQAQGSTPSQVASLEANAMTHANRETSSWVQTSGFGATAICYSGLMVYSGGTAATTANIIKLSAATLLGGYYGYRALQHRKYKKEVKQIASKLRGLKGDCNPHTDRNCYCSQESTQYDPQYCLLGGADGTTSISRAHCVDKQLNFDPSCKCLEGQNCYSQDQINFEVGTGSSLEMQSSLDSAGKIYNGNAISGDLESTAAGLGAAARKSALKHLDKVPDVQLGDKESKTAETLASTLKIPRKMARLLVSKGPGSSSMAQKLRAGLARKSRSRRYKRTPRSKVLTFSKGLGPRKASRGARNNSMSDLMARLNRKAGKKGGTRGPGNKVLRFRQRAANRADIHQDKNSGIFQIISRRYQLSAPKE